MRKVARGDHGEMPAVPITVRQLEAIVRISEALARMQLQPVATEAHVREAIDLFKTSTMDAVKSGAVGRRPVPNDVVFGTDAASWRRTPQRQRLLI